MARRPPQAPAIRKLPEKSSENQGEGSYQTGFDYTKKRYRQDDSAIEVGLDPSLLLGELEEGHPVEGLREPSRHQPEHRRLAQASLAAAVSSVWSIGPGSAAG